MPEGLRQPPCRDNRKIPVFCWPGAFLRGDIPLQPLKDMGRIFVLPTADLPGMIRSLM